MSRVKEARKMLGSLQTRYKISPEESVYISERWDMAFEKDPEGSQLIRLVKELEELITPMRT